MKIFIVPTENFIKSSKTFLSAAAVASGSPVSISVESNESFSINDYNIIGIEGNENAEIKLITGTPSSQITVATLSFAHKKGEPIVKIAFNQRKLYGCATKDGTFVFIETKNISVDNPQGTYFSYTGVYEWFKATYYNETTLEETDIADAIATQAGEVSRYCSVFDIREESGFKDNSYIDDGRIDALRLQAESEVKSSIGAIYSLPLSASCEVIKTIAKLLAAGWLMWQEYGEESSGTSKDGMAKVTEARSMLKAIREHRLILFDENDIELALALSSVSGGTIDGYPNNSTPDGEKAQFEIDKVF